MKLTVRQYSEKTGKSFQSIYRKIERGTLETTRERINGRDVLFILVDETNNSTQNSTDIPQQFNHNSTQNSTDIPQQFNHNSTHNSTDIPHDTQPQFNPNSTANSTPDSTRALEAMIELLKCELRDRKQELESLRQTRDREVSELHQLLFYEQRLHAQDRALLEAYQNKERQSETAPPPEEKEPPVEEHQETVKKKRSWWRFF